MNLFKRQRMRYHPLEVELTGFENTARAVPGVEDASTRDAQYGCALENDIVGKVKLNHVRGNAQQRNAPAAAQRLKALADGDGMTRHFQHDIDTEAIGDIEYLLHRINFARVDDIVGSHLGSYIEPLVVGFNGKDGAGP